jgi:hypothetical protein
MEDWKVGWLEERPIRAKVLTPRAREWVGETCRADVLHVFERSCNLINEQGEILSLVTSELDAGPFTIVVNNSAAPFDNWVMASTPVEMKADELVLGERLISLRIAVVWDPRPPWEHLRTGIQAIVANLEDVSNLLQLHAPANSFAQLAYAGEVSKVRHRLLAGDQINARILDAALAPATWLCEGIIENEASLLIKGARGLAGLGGGLTPSGDDYLMGAICAAWLLNFPPRAASIAAQIVDCAASRTTQLSSAWLRAAQRGEAGLRWHLLLSALISGDHAEISSAVRELTSVGHTSGADALAGFLAVLNLHQRFSSPITVHP